MNKGKIKHSGFTLVELLVVISIIALLLAVLMPSLSKARGLAKRIVCGSQVRNISLAMMSYSQTYGCLFPVGNGWAWCPVGPGSDYKDYTAADLDARDKATDGPYWAIAYVPYGAKKEMFRDPAKKKNFYGRNDPATKPQEFRDAGNFSDYTINGYACWKDSTKTAMTQNAWPIWKEQSNRPVELRKLTDFKRPSSMILLHDGYEGVLEFNRPGDNGPGDSYVRPRSGPDTYIAEAKANLWQWRKGDADDEFCQSPERLHRGAVREYWRHDGSSVILWLDGHSSVLKETTGEDFNAEWYTGGLVDEY